MEQRPIGITIISVLCIISGTGMFVMQLFIDESFVEIISELNIDNFTMIFSIILLASLALIGGIGMLLGKKWGWWVGAFYLIYAVFRYLNVLVQIPLFEIQYEVGSAETTQYYTKYIGRIITNSLLYLYFFKSNVLSYFNLGEIRKRKVVFSHLGIGLVLAGGSIISSIFSIVGSV